MTTKEKANKVFQSGLAFRIWNKPVQNDQLWDIKIFWAHMEYDNKNIVVECDNKGFDTLDDCLDNCITYLKNYVNEEKEN
jgi:hypothetical protein